MTNNNNGLHHGDDLHLGILTLRRRRHHPAPSGRERAQGEMYFERGGKQIMVDFQNAGDFMPSDE